MRNEQSANSYIAVYFNLFIYSNVSFIGLLNLCKDNVYIVYTLYERSLFQAVILAEKCSLRAFMAVAEKPAVHFLKPAENQKNYGLGLYT